jgi:hypothetical protein
MKRIFLFLAAALAGFVAGIGPIEAKTIWIDEKSPIKVSFDTKGHQFFKGTDGELGTPAEAFLKLVAVKGDEKTILPATQSLKGYVVLKTPSDALEFVRLFTNLDTQYLFKDADWIEVKNGGTDIVEGERGFGEMLNFEYQKFALFGPKVEAAGGGFVIERC